jgi:hypothetical protein
VNYYVSLRTRTRDSASGPLVLWALVTAVALVLWELHGRHYVAVTWAWALYTFLTGALVARRGKSGWLWFAPVVSWLFAWVPLWIATLWRHGFVKGLFVGLFLVTFGWLFVGLAEVLVLGLGAMVGRRGRRHRVDEDDVVIIGPDDFVN